MTADGVTRPEWRWVLLASLVVLLFASLPTLYAWWLADDANVFSGFVYNTEDGNSYIAKMRQGARGEWLFHLPFTTEPHPGAWLYTFHLLLGKVSAGLGLSFQLTYHLVRAILGLGLLVTVYAFVARFVTDVVTRRLAWLLTAIGSGLGWLLTFLGATQWLGSLPLDFWVPEAYVFLVLYSLPHLALAEIALLWSLLLLLDAFHEYSAWRAIAAGCCGLVMTIIVPFYPLVLAAILGIFILVSMLRQKKVPWREIGLAALAGLFCAPVVIYNVWLTATEPVYHTWANQLHILSPHPLHYILGYAPLLVPAIWGLKNLIQDHHAGLASSDPYAWWLIIAWLIAAPILIYLPFISQRRLIVLAQVPLALLAAVGLRTWFGNRRWMQVAYVFVASLSILLLVFGSLGPIRERERPVFHPGAEIAALQWLDSYAETGAAVLASFQVGNITPARADLRAFAGHGPETLHSTTKLGMIERFFQSGTDAAWRESILRDYELDYVFYGPGERSLGDWDPSAARYLVEVYAEQGYTIYAVQPEELQP
jgi:hypothetical protein